MPVRWMLSVFVMLFFVSAPMSQAREVILLSGIFQEVDSASPVVGHATFPLDLTKAVIAATPKKYKDEVKESGFDLDIIFAALEAMPVGETFELTQDDYYLKINKLAMTVPDDALPSLLVIRSESLKLPVPLGLTSTAATLLQYTIKELQGMEKELTAMLEEVKKTPPGTILKGEDTFMNSWLEIRLQ